MRLAWIVCFVLFITPFAFAQKETGAIDGMCKDIEGKPIPGVMVTVSSPSLIGGSATAYTDENGYYRFPALGSGTYTVRAQLSGFQTMIRENVRIFVGQTLSVFFNLELVKTSEYVEVTDKPPLIDASTTAVSVIVPPEIIQSLPKQDNIENLLTLTPGVSDDLVAYGGDGPKANALWIDGVSVSDPRNGTLNVAYDYNWIDEVQVIGLGAPAEYGGFTGVLANFTTRSGGNAFHGLLETFFRNEKLTSSNVPDPAKKIPFKTYDVSTQLGGPIIRNKLWFFTGYEYPRTQTHPFGFNGLITDTNEKFITKLTYKWNQNNNLQGFIHWNDHYVQNANAGPDVAPEAIADNKFHQSSWNTTWTSLWSPQTTLDLRIGGTYDHQIPVEDHPDVPGHFGSGGTYTFYGNDILRVDDDRQRVQANATVSHYARNFIHGSHDFRFGVEFERSHAFLQGRFNGGMYYYDVNSQPYDRFIISGYDYDGRNDRLSSFVQDEWSVTNSLTISAGLRWDHNRGYTDRGLVLSNDPVAPRVGLIWKLDRDNQTVVKFSYGDYYEALLNRNYYFLTDRNPVYTFQQFINGQWVTNAVLAFNPTRSSKLNEPYTRQVTAGIDRVLPWKIPISARYIYKRWGNILEDYSLDPYAPIDTYVSPITGETITIYHTNAGGAGFFFTNPTGLYRHYDGFELTVTKQFTNRLSVSASLNYSRFSGNSPGDRGEPAANTGFYDDPNSLTYYPGKLGSDRPIQWKVVGAYPLPWGFNAGWYLRHTSGDAYAAGVGYVKAGRPFPFFLIEPAGSRRLPSRTLLDLRFEKEFPFYHGQLRTAVDVFNVLNSSYVTRISNFYGEIDPDGFHTEDFGTPYGYNDPREIRLGLRYTF